MYGGMIGDSILAHYPSEYPLNIAIRHNNVCYKFYL